MSPNGRTWYSVTRERASMRRSLPATSAVSRQRFIPPAPLLLPGVARSGHVRLRDAEVGDAAGEDDLAAGEGAGPVELVRGQDDGAALGGGGGDHRVEHGAAGGVEAGVGLVEEQEPRVAREHDGEREPASLPRREATVHDVGLRRQPDPLERDVGRRTRRRRRRAPRSGGSRGP